MANKRMFNIKIVDSDAFIDMPLSTQCLYFHLNMRADDDGFVGNPKRIQRLVGATDDDLKLLIAKRFILTFENGVIVIKHWRMHNTLSVNRYTQTVYTDEKSCLLLKDNNSYSFNSGTPIDDKKYIEMSKRQSRRTTDEQKTNTDIYKDKDIDLDKDLDIDKDTDKEKKETYVSIIDDYTSSDELKMALKDFVKMRQQIKGFTHRALRLALNKLDEIALDDYTKIDVVNQSVMNGWKSFYPLHTKQERKENRAF